MSFVQSFSGEPGFAASSTLAKLELVEIPEDHPVHIAAHTYAAESVINPQLMVPFLETLVPNLPIGVLNHSLLLKAVETVDGGDFEILRRGRKFPGVQRDGATPYYADGLAPELAIERLLELFMVLATRRPRLTTGRSGRFGARKLAVFRGIFPLWSQVEQSPLALLVVAPTYQN